MLRMCASLLAAVAAPGFCSGEDLRDVFGGRQPNLLLAFGSWFAMSRYMRRRNAFSHADRSDLANPLKLGKTAAFTLMDFAPSFVLVASAAKFVDGLEVKR